MGGIVGVGGWDNMSVGGKFQEYRRDMLGSEWQKNSRVLVASGS